MSAQPLARPASDAAARLSRQMNLQQIDQQFTSTFEAIRDRRDARYQDALQQSLNRVRRAMVGLAVTPGPVARILGDPELVRLTVSILAGEAQRTHTTLAAIQGDAEIEWADAKATRAALRQPYEFGGATSRRRLTVLSPNTAQEA